MNALTIKTPSEQKLEWFGGLTRPLTEEESDDLYRCLHNVYVTEINRRNRRLTKVREMELETAARIEAENGWRQ